MIKENNDDIIKEDEIQDEDNSESNDNETSKEEALTPEQATALIRGLQGGYTQTSQQLAELKSLLQEKKDSAEDGDEYVTVSKLKSVLQEIEQTRNSRNAEADRYVVETLNDLKAKGIVKSKEDEDDLLRFALDIEESDLLKASKAWTIAINKANEKANKTKEDVAKVKARQEEGSKVGDTKQAGDKQQGVNYLDVLKMSDF